MIWPAILEKQHHVHMTDRHEKILLNALLANQIDGFLVLDGDGLIRYFNKACELIFGYSAREAIGRNISQLVENWAVDLTVFDDHQCIAGEHYIGLSKSGRAFPLHLSLSCNHDHDTAFFCGIARDISQRKAAEDRLMHAHKMEAVGQLTSGIAHNFNNLLTIILGSTRLLKKAAEDVILPDDFLRYMEAIDTTAHRGANQIRRLMTFARQQYTESEITDIGHFIEDLREMISLSVRSDILVHIDIPEDLWDARLDHTHFESVLLNMVSNAVDAMPDGGSLRIEAGNAVLDDNYTLLSPDVKPGDYICLTISDTGCGMPKAVADRIFEPFFTTKCSGQGTGLGMSSAYGYITQIGGYIHVYSEEGYGTTFKIYLPRHHDNKTVISYRTNKTARHPLKKGTGRSVLVVDDNPLMKDMALQSFQRLGFHVYTASDAMEAMQIIEQASPRIDVLFVDLFLGPDSLGTKLAEELLSAGLDFPVLYTSGYSFNALPDLFSIDPAHFIAKPFSCLELSEKIAGTIARRAA